MSDTDKRDQVGKLVKKDPRQALLLARGIEDPWFRAQALSWVARFTNGDPTQIAYEAANAAKLCSDAYKISAVRAWEVAMLAEREKIDQAKKALAEAIATSKLVTPNSSKADALILLLNAATRIGNAETFSVSEEILSVIESDSHWRCTRALKDAVSILAKLDANAAKEFTLRITSDKARKQAEAALKEGGRDSRPFYW